MPTFSFHKYIPDIAYDFILAGLLLFLSFFWTLHHGTSSLFAGSLSLGVTATVLTFIMVLLDPEAFSGLQNNKDCGCTDPIKTIGFSVGMGVSAVAASVFMRLVYRLFQKNKSAKADTGDVELADLKKQLKAHAQMQERNVLRQQLESAKKAAA